MKIFSSDKGFTIVETLVAVAVLMIAIAGPLTVANKAFTAALDARNETIGSSLAQEALEYINNLKDNGQRPTLFTTDPCTQGSPCGVSITPSNPTAPLAVVDLCSNLNNCLLTDSDATLGYTYSINGIKTVFTRSFYVTTLASDEALVTVTVSWSTGGVPNSVKLQQLLTSYSRS